MLVGANVWLQVRERHFKTKVGMLSCDIQVHAVLGEALGAITGSSIINVQGSQCSALLVDQESFSQLMFRVFRLAL